MRVIAGSLRGRRLAAPAGRLVRPSSDALRETLFNVLGPAVAGSLWVDGFAGSGAVGIEALSRGAEFAWFLESARAARATLASNLRALELRERACVLARPAPAGLAALAAEPRLAARGGCDFFFLDPPYREHALHAATLAALASIPGLLAPSGCIVAEHGRKHELAAAYGPWVRVRVLPQGDSQLTFFRRIRQD